MEIALAVVFGIFLAYANGANDCFKGVATLFGSGTTTYRRALIWSAATTFLGSLVALVLAHGLLATFSGKGLVPDTVVAMKSFSLAVGLAAAGTVMLATMLGFPISTTHALTGALVGAGFFASGEGVNFSRLGTAFFLPLLLSPFVAMALATLGYSALRFVRERSGVEKETCICVGTEVIGVVPQGMSAAQALARVRLPSISVDRPAVCVERYQGRFLGFPARLAIDGLHFLSGGTVCFARALNDTPKVAATLLIGGAISPSFAILSAAMAMTLGGLLSSRKVADTMSLRVTSMSPGQGLSANLVTGLLVIFASKLGLPVSTTHVSCGTLFGIGAVNRRAQWRVIGSIVLAWVTTLPIAAALGAGVFAVLKYLI